MDVHSGETVFVLRSKKSTSKHIQGVATQPNWRGLLSVLPLSFVPLITQWLDCASLCKLFMCGSKLLNQTLTAPGVVSVFSFDDELMAAKPLLTAFAARFPSLLELEVYCDLPLVGMIPFNQLPASITAITFCCELGEFACIGDLDQYSFSHFTQLHTLELPAIDEDFAYKLLHVMPQTLRKLNLSPSAHVTHFGHLPRSLTALIISVNDQPPLSPAVWKTLPESLERLEIDGFRRYSFFEYLPASLTALNAAPIETIRHMHSRPLNFETELKPALKALPDGILELSLQWPQLTDALAKALPPSLTRLAFLPNPDEEEDYDADADDVPFYIPSPLVFGLLPRSLTFFKSPRPIVSWDMATTDSAATFLLNLPPNLTSLPTWLWDKIPQQNELGQPYIPSYQQNALRSLQQINILPHLKEIHLGPNIQPENLEMLKLCSSINELNLDCAATDFSDSEHISLPRTLTLLEIRNYRRGGLGRILLRSDLPYLSEVILTICSHASASLLRFVPSTITTLTITRLPFILNHEKGETERFESLREEHVIDHSYECEADRDTDILDSSDDEREGVDIGGLTHIEEPFDAVLDSSLLTRFKFLELLTLEYLSDHRPSKNFLKTLPVTLTELNLRSAHTPVDCIYQLSRLTNLTKLAVEEPQGIFSLAHILSLPPYLRTFECRSEDPEPDYDHLEGNPEPFPAISRIRDHQWALFPRTLTRLTLPVPIYYDPENKRDADAMHLTGLPFLYDVEIFLDDMDDSSAEEEDDWEGADEDDATDDDDSSDDGEGTDESD